MWNSCNVASSASTCAGRTPHTESGACHTHGLLSVSGTASGLGCGIAGGCVCRASSCGGACPCHSANSAKCCAGLEQITTCYTKKAALPGQRAVSRL